jgi:hypothetical protein
VASDVTSLQSIQGELAVPRRTCSRGVVVIPGPGGEELLSWFFSSPARCRCGSLVVPHSLLGLARHRVDPRGHRPHAVLSSGHLAMTGFEFKHLGSSLPFRATLARPGRSSTFLSWDSSGLTHAPGISARFVCPRPHRPFIDMLSGVHSRWDVSIPPSAPGIPCQKSRSDLVVSHHFAGLRRQSFLRTHTLAGV